MMNIRGRYWTTDPRRYALLRFSVHPNAWITPAFGFGPGRKSHGLRKSLKFFFGPIQMGIIWGRTDWDRKKGV